MCLVLNTKTCKKISNKFKSLKKVVYGDKRTLNVASICLYYIYIYVYLFAINYITICCKEYSLNYVAKKMMSALLKTITMLTTHHMHTRSILHPAPQTNCDLTQICSSHIPIYCLTHQLHNKKYL